MIVTLMMVRGEKAIRLGRQQGVAKLNGVTHIAMVPGMMVLKVWISGDKLYVQ